MRVHIKSAASHRAVQFIATDIAAGVPSWFRVAPEHRKAVRTSPAHGEFRRDPGFSDVSAELITPGYLVILSVDGVEMEYHTDDVDRAVRCDLQ